MFIGKFEFDLAISADIISTKPASDSTNNYLPAVEMDAIPCAPHSPPVCSVII